MPADTYWRLARAPRYSILFALPLLVLYEGLAAAVDLGPTPVRNGADVLLKSLVIGVAGARGPLLLALIVGGTGLVLVVRDVRRHGGASALRGRIFAGMALEAIVWSILTGPIVGIGAQQLLHRLGLLMVAPQGVGTLGELARVTLSLGAGLYEELLFRVLLVGGLAALASRVAGAGPRAAGIFAVVVAALVFSAFHYVGPYGDPWSLGSFTFRALAGVFFSALYLLRGFGVTAWTHALYDLWLLA